MAANNASLPMLELADKYSATAIESQQVFSKLGCILINSACRHEILVRKPQEILIPYHPY